MRSKIAPQNLSRLLRTIVAFAMVMAIAALASWRWLPEATAQVASNPLRTAAATSAIDEKAPEQKPAEATSAIEQPPAAATEEKHPLDPAIEIAHKAMDHINRDIKDYTCTLIKRERVDGKLIGPVTMDVKIRQKPFSVYLNFLDPPDQKGREVLYIEGANDGKMVAREGSGLKRELGMVWLKPTSFLAMDGNRYPITDIGIAHLTSRLIEVAEHDRSFGECEVHFYKNAKVNKRVCTVIEVIHPTPRRTFGFSKARIYVDDELNLPIHYEAYSWPTKPGGDQVLDEDYTYTRLKLNVGLTDADFDYHNPKYGFIDK